MATLKSISAPSAMMAVARIAVGLMFLMFAQYKLLHTDFAHEGYQKYVTGYVQESSVSIYKPFLRETLLHPKLWAYAVGVVELLIGISMVVGFAVRPFSLVGALYMLNLTLATWKLPAGTPAWRYVGNELDHIPLLLLFLIFFAHGAGEAWGLDGKKPAT
jgi:uncharacterized membrane protein YphA (DoxX/SURF4 family)